MTQNIMPKSFNWITNPYDPQISDLNDKLLNLLVNNYQGNIITNNYDQQIINSYNVTLNKNINEDDLSFIYKTLFEINYQPLILSLTMDSDVFNSTDLSNISLNVRGLMLILTYYLNNQLNLNLDLNQQDVLTTYIEYQIINDQINNYYTINFIFKPYNQLYYVNNLWLAELNSKLDINQLWGYTTIGSDPLLFYVADQVPYNQYISYDQKLSLFLLQTISDEDNISDSIIDLQDISTQLAGLKANNYIGMSDITAKKRQLFKEIGLLWNIEEIYYNQAYLTAIYKAKYDESISFYPTLNDWLYQSYEDINNNLLPKIRWRNKYSSYMKYQIDDRIRLSYALLKSYAKLANTNKALSQYIIDIYVYNDLTMEARFASYKQFKEVDEYITEILENFEYSDWQLKSLDNIEEGLVYRYYYQQEDNNSLPVIINIDNQLYLVSDKPKTIKHLNYQKYQIIKVAIEKMLNLYYQTNDLNINQLINMIKLNSGSYKISSIQLPIDPETNEPLTGQQLYDLSNHIYAVYGYYPLGIKDIPELNKSALNYTPSISNQIKLDFGNIEKIDILNTCLSMYNVYFNIDDDNYYYKLLTLNGQEDMSNLILNVWKCGYFLSAWGLSYYQITGLFSYDGLYIYPFIKESIASVNDSKTTIAYLNLIYQDRCI